MLNGTTLERKELWHRLGYCDEMTKPQAERRRDEILRGVNREVQTIGSYTLFRDFAARYKQEHFPALGAGTQQKYDSHLSTHLLPEFGDLRLVELDTLRIQAFLNRKAEAGLSWWTRSDLRNLLKGIFTKAAAWKYWPKDEPNPVIGTNLGRKKAKREKRILSDEQLRLLLPELPALIALMVRTAVSTGMRISEILALKWKCVDLDKGTVRVEERYYRGDLDEPKSDKSRRTLPIGLLVDAYKDLAASKPNHDCYVFHDNGEPLDDRALLKDVIRPAAKRLGLYFVGFGWHSFRRQNITVIQEVGATVFEAQAQAGHSDPATTSEYTITNLDRRTAAVLKLQERLLTPTVH